MTMQPTASRQFRAGRSVAAVVIYLVGFFLLILLVSHYYLLPALKVSRHADHEAKRLLALQATLVMLVVLFLSFTGLLITFRVSRFFRPRPSTPAKPTEYVDAWKESGKRMQVPDEDAEEE